MRQSALSQPPTPSLPPRHDVAANDDAPRETLTRLVAAQPLAELGGIAAHTRPTTPVPSDYLFLTQRRPDDVSAGLLAGRLESLAEDLYDVGDRLPIVEDAWAGTFDPITETRTVIPDGEPANEVTPPSRGMFSLLSSVALVPYLRRAPGDIPRGTIDHGQACVLALVDGRTTIEQILDTSPMPVPRVLRILRDLLESGVVGLRG